ncbi:magnesium transporter [Segnochrobactraceae bacterium EtOH-i3]
MTAAPHSSDLSHTAETALDLACTGFVRLPPTATCGAALARFAEPANADGPDHAAIVDAGGRFLGLVGVRDCLARPAQTPLSEVLTRPGLTIPANWSAEETAREMVRVGEGCLPVLDEAGRVVALLTDRVAYLFVFEMADEDAARVSGIVGELHDHDDYMQISVWRDYARRIPWIFGLAVVGLAAGYVVHAYESALDVLVILALYMPMIADTGGNVGTQSASLVTRAISFGGLTMRDAAGVLWRELRVAALLAGTLFIFTYLKVFLLSNTSEIPQGLDLSAIAVAIGVALAVQVVTATLIGAVLPLASVALRQDPAVVSGPALTTIVDVSGLLLYFTITTRMLGIHVAGG